MKNENNPLNVTVSYCKNNKDQQPTDVNLYEFLTDGRFKDQVMALRNETDEAKQKVLKDALPACLVSGLFSGRSADSLKKASGLICVDIDAGPNSDVADFENLKKHIKECPYVLFCAHSARGKGFFCIIRISEPKKFREHFLSLERDFKRAGIVIDASCKNINRLRYAFYDPEPYINLDAVVYDRVIEANRKSTRIVTNEYVGGDKINNAYRMGLLTATLDKQGKDITENYDDWFNMACGIANEFGEDGRIMFRNLSKNYDGYDPDKADFEYDKALRYHYDQVPIGKIFDKYAADNGVSLGDYMF